MTHAPGHCGPRRGSRAAAARAAAAVWVMGWKRGAGTLLLLLLLGISGLLLGLSGCASIALAPSPPSTSSPTGAPPSLRPLPSAEAEPEADTAKQREEGAVAPAVGEGALRPWELATDAFQALYRVRFESAQEGDGSFRLTLRFVRRDRFQLAATGPLGRSLWSLEVTGPDALLVDHRQRRACPLDTDMVLDQRLLGSFPLAHLPALIVGRVPQRPAHAGLDPESGKSTMAFRDPRGRRWVVGLDPENGDVERWSVESSDGELVARMLRRDDGWRELFEPDGSLELRWQEVLREPLPNAPAFLEIPEGYVRTACVESPVGRTP